MNEGKKIDPASGALPAREQDFHEWFAANYNGEVVFSDPRWHSESILRWARRALASREASSAPLTEPPEGEAERRIDLPSDCEVSAFNCGWRSAALASPQVAPDPTVEDMCARIKAADDAAAGWDYMLDSNDCISVLRGTWKAPLANDHPKPRQVVPAPEAHLKAAAPDLLAALQVVVADWTAQFERNGHRAPAWCKQAREAIAKATGEQA